jgi:hypothetical protein
MKERVTSFSVWHNGDSSVGIDGDRAIVQYDCSWEASTHIELVKQCLKECFSQIWDFEPQVMTNLEMDCLIEGEREIDKLIDDAELPVLNLPDFPILRDMPEIEYV